MDLQMRVTGGWEATRRLESDPEAADMPVIVVTAEDHTAARLAEAGFSPACATRSLLGTCRVRWSSAWSASGGGVPRIELPSSEVAPPGS
jgi:hypothetical protein